MLYLRGEARFANLLKLPEGANIGAAINVAMKAIEEENEDLCGVLPQNYTAFDNSLLVSLLKTLNVYPTSRATSSARSLSVLPRQVRDERKPEGRRVLRAAAAGQGPSRK